MYENVKKKEKKAILCCCPPIKEQGTQYNSMDMLSTLSLVA